MIPLQGEGRTAGALLAAAAERVLAAGPLRDGSNHAEAVAILARIDFEEGRPENGRRGALRARELLGQPPASEHWAYWIQVVRVADVLILAGESKSARALLEPALAGFEAQLGPDHPSASATRARLTDLSR
jgi:hypothetical protein